MAWALCLAIGLCAGFLAGLFGVGGGTVIVPALLLFAPALGLAGQDAAPVAIATSLAIVIPTSVSSARAHALRGAIDWCAFRRMAPGIAAGALAGTWMSGPLGGRAMTAAFIGVALLAARRLVAPAAGADDRDCHAGSAALPCTAALTRRALAIGVVSALAGVGGGLLSVPLLAHYLPLKRAVGTAAALGLPLATAALAGDWLSGQPASCAAGCIGRVFLPAVVAVSLAAIVMAPLGARLAARLPVPALRRAFAAMLLLVCTGLTVGVFR
jgi:uncharacterized membrane protein YfcA